MYAVPGMHTLPSHMYSVCIFTVLLMISCLCGVAQLIHTRAEEGGLGTAEGKQKKMKKSKDSVQRAIKIAENASRNHAHMILDMRGQ